MSDNLVPIKKTKRVPRIEPEMVHWIICMLPQVGYLYPVPAQSAATSTRAQLKFPPLALPRPSSSMERLPSASAQEPSIQQVCKFPPILHYNNKVVVFEWNGLADPITNPFICTQALSLTFTYFHLLFISDSHHSSSTQKSESEIGIVDLPAISEFRLVWVV